MKCDLEKKITHKGITPKFRNTLVYCPLVAKDSIGMKSLGTVCAGCCIRIHQVLEKRSDLILTGKVSQSELKRNDGAFYQFLSDILKLYAENLPEIAGRNWVAIAGECSRCSARTVGNEEPVKVEPTEITFVGRRDL